MQTQPGKTKIRKPEVAGRFYPADPEKLSADIRKYLMNSGRFAGDCAGREVLGLMLPHAGYVFSGAVVGLTLGQVPVPERVVLLGPSHSGRGSSISVWPSGAWRTPLGDVRVDEEIVSELCAGSTLFKADVNGHLGDHALEVILPFLQVLNPQLKIVPVTVRNYDLENLDRAGRELAGFIEKRRVKGEKICMAASSDMSHFLPHDISMRKDALALSQIKEINPAGLFTVVTQNNISMCGFAPVTLMLFACRELGANECCITAHTSSGITGKSAGAGMQSVVGYAGAIIPAPV